MAEAQPTGTTSPSGSGAHNLPGYASSFVGRDAQIAGAIGLLANERLVTLVGTGGVGKTRLALQVAAAAAPSYRDGVWLVELAGVSEASQVEESVLAVLPDLDRNPRGAPRLIDHLAELSLLLVLDNCEQVVAGCAAVAQRLLRRCFHLAMLVTSREPLGVAGERLWWVAPLELPRPDVRDAEEAGAAESVRLFVERGRSACPGFRLTADNLPEVAEICRRLDGLPLALELAAARLAVLSPAEIVARLDDRFALLSHRSPIAETRHQTLRAALEWSHELLTEDEALLMTRLAVFAGGCSLAAAEQVCADATLPAGGILDLLDALVAKSLVVVDRSGPETRYRMLESIRHFALTKVGSTAALDALAERHARWCLQRAEEVERVGRTRSSDISLEALEEDHDNFRAVLGWARDHDRADMVLALGVALSWFWEAKGHYREGLDWLTYALAGQPDGDDELHARALRSAGMLRWMLGDVAEAVPLVEASVVLFRRAGNEEEAGGCVCTGAFHLCANPVHSLPGLAANLARVRAGDNVGRLAHALINCGMAHFFVSDAERARACFDECLTLPLGAEREVFAAALLGRGRVALLLGDLGTADGLFREARDEAQRAGDDDRQSVALSWMGELQRLHGEYRTARNLLAGAAALVDDGGSPISLARCNQFLGRLAATEGHLDDARALFEKSLALPGARDLPYHRVRSLQGLADVALAHGECDAARVLIDETLAVADVNGDLQAHGRALVGRAALARIAGDAPRAARLAHQAVEIQARIGDTIGIVSSLEMLAELGAQGARPEVAARLAGAAQHFRQSLSCSRTPAEAAERARVMETLATRLEAGELAQALAQGASMIVAEAVSYATKGWGSKARPAMGWDSLTRAERDVALLVGDGLTNQQIGERLFVSARTVSTHVSHILGKLAVASRREVRGCGPLTSVSVRGG